MAETTLNQNQLLFLDSSVTQGTLELSGSNIALDATNQLNITSSGVITVTSGSQDIVVGNTRLVFRTNGDTYTPPVVANTLFLDMVNNDTTNKSNKVVLYGGTSGENSLNIYNGGTLSNRLVFGSTTTLESISGNIVVSSTSGNITLQANGNIDLTNSIRTVRWPTTDPTLDNSVLRLRTTNLDWYRPINEYWYTFISANAGVKVFIGPNYYTGVANTGVCKYMYIPSDRNIVAIAVVIDEEYYDEWTPGTNSTIELFRAGSGGALTPLVDTTFQKSDTTLINSGRAPDNTSNNNASYLFTFSPQSFSAGEYYSVALTVGSGVGGGEVCMAVYWY